MRPASSLFLLLVAGWAACTTEPRLGDVGLVRLRAELSRTTVSPGDTVRVRVVATNPQSLAVEYTVGCPLPGVSYRVYDAAGEVRDGLRECIPEDRAVRQRIGARDSVVITGFWTPMRMLSLNTFVPRSPGAYAVVPTLEATETTQFGAPVAFSVTP